jgi:hypothetical protein
VIDGKTHHFSAGGLYNGLVLLIDDETRTYWDHITGEAVLGPLKGAGMEPWGVDMTTLAAALEADPETTLSRHKVHPFARLFGFIHRRAFRHGGFLPPRFRGTMGEEDRRLPRMTHGLGVVVDGEARFFPAEGLRQGREFAWNGRALRLGLGEKDKVPFAIWEDDGSRPFQLFTRFYGFAFTYSGGAIEDGRA